MQEQDHDFLTKTARICGIHLGILMLYSAAMWMTCNAISAASIDFLLEMAIAVGLQVGISLCIALVYLMQWKVNQMLAHGLSALLVAMIGYSICAGGGYLLPHGV